MHESMQSFLAPVLTVQLSAPRLSVQAPAPKRRDVLSSAAASVPLPEPEGESDIPDRPNIPVYNAYHHVCCKSFTQSLQTPAMGLACFITCFQRLISTSSPVPAGNLVFMTGHGYGAANHDDGRSAVPSDTSPEPGLLALACAAAKAAQTRSDSVTAATGAGHLSAQSLPAAQLTDAAGAETAPASHVAATPAGSVNLPPIRTASPAAEAPAAAGSGGAAAAAHHDGTRGAQRSGVGSTNGSTGGGGSTACQGTGVRRHRQLTTATASSAAAASRVVLTFPGCQTRHRQVPPWPQGRRRSPGLHCPRHPMAHRLPPHLCSS
jgi:hypothetical protein